MRKKPNAGEVYYNILKYIRSCRTEEQLNKCEVLIDKVRFYRFSFAEALAGEAQIKRYPVHE